MYIYIYIHIHLIQNDICIYTHDTGVEGLLPSPGSLAVSDVANISVDGASDSSKLICLLYLIPTITTRILTLTIATRNFCRHDNDDVLRVVAAAEEGAANATASQQL